jgi:hypothetical protein
MRNPTRISAATAMAMFLGFTTVLGQERGTLYPLYSRDDICQTVENGARIRLQVNSDFVSDVPETQGDEGILTGRFESCEDGVLLLKRGTDVVPVPVKTMQSLYVSQSRSSHAFEGAAIGLTIGILVAVATQSGGSKSDGFMSGMNDFEEKIGRSIGITLVGTLAGAAIGSTMVDEDWKRIYDENVGGSFHSDLPGEYRAAVSLSF